MTEFIHVPDIYSGNGRVLANRNSDYCASFDPDGYDDTLAGFCWNKFWEDEHA